MGASVLRPNCLPIEGLALFAGQPETSFLPFGGMQKGKARFRRPTADEQTVLLGMSVKLLVRAQDIRKCDQLLIDHHYLHSSQLVGEQLRYAVTWKGQWLAVATWSAAALHLKARDQFIGWTEEQRRQRLPLVGEQLRYAVTWKGQWLAVATWSAAALHLKARDQFIGWTEEQRRQRLPLVVNNRSEEHTSELQSLRHLVCRL